MWRDWRLGARQRSPTMPSTSSRTMSIRPVGRAVSSIMPTSTGRDDTALQQGGAAYRHIPGGLPCQAEPLDIRSAGADNRWSCWPRVGSRPLTASRSGQLLRARDQVVTSPARTRSSREPYAAPVGSSPPSRRPCLQSRDGPSRGRRLSSRAAPTSSLVESCRAGARSLSGALSHAGARIARRTHGHPDG